MPAGRPKGSKDSKPRKTEKRALAALSDLRNAGYGPANIAKENLEMLDYLINRSMKDLEKAEELLPQAESALGPKEYLSYLTKMNVARDQLYKLIAQRQKWVVDVSKYTDYTKGTERVVKDEEGDYHTVGDLLKGKTTGPLIGG